jgi:hypothetical protein
LTNLKSQTFVFGSEARIPNPSKDAIKNPGPGSYTLPPKYSGPKYAMGMKLTDNDPISKNKNPGPGSYNNDTNPLRDKSPAYSLSGKASRENSPERRNGTPGPGQYKVTS